MALDSEAFDLLVSHSDVSCSTDSQKRVSCGFVYFARVELGASICYAESFSLVEEIPTFSPLSISFFPQHWLDFSCFVQRQRASWSSIPFASSCGQEFSSVSLVIH